MGSTELYSESNGLYKLTLQFQERSLVNGLVLIQDEATSTDFKKNLLWGFSIYIGDSVDYLENNLCPGSPFLPDGDVLDRLSIGMEIWCNLEGSYITLVRDFKDYQDIESISICDFAIFGEPAPLYIYKEQRTESARVKQYH